MPAPFTYLDLVHTKIFLPPSLLVLASLRLPTKDVIFFIPPCMYFKYSLCVRAHFVCILSHTWGGSLPACIHVCAHVVCVLVVCVHVCKHACVCYSTCIVAHDCVSSLSTLFAWLCVCVCVCVCCMHWILKICAYGLCGLGALSTHYYLYESL